MAPVEQPAIVESPIGPLTGWTRGGVLIRLGFGCVPGVAAPVDAGSGAVVEALRRYFSGELDAIDAVPVEAAGTTFQRLVWARLRQVPAGTTTTYAALARELGRPRAVRAVGRANATNPVAIVVPCHRVVRSDGGLAGYGGGLARKSWLIAHERGEAPRYVLARGDDVPSGHR